MENKSMLDLERDCWRWLVGQPSQRDMLRVLETLTTTAPDALSAAIFSDGFTPEVIALIEEGKKVAAIKAFRDHPHCPNRDLKYCKEAIEKYASFHGIGFE